MNGIEQRWKFKDIAIALGLICIILVVSLAGVIVYYVSVVNGKDNTIQTDNNQISSLSSEVNYLNGVIDLYDIETLFNQNASVQAGQTMVYEFTANYSGYISVTMDGLNLTSTWVKVTWGQGVAGGGGEVIYDETRNFTGGSNNPFGGDVIDTEYFPILENGGSYEAVTIGNSGNQTITEVLTITFYY
jgi:hypothetical protein